MLELKQYLSNFENKTGWVAFALGILTFLESATTFITASTLGIITTVSAVLLLLLKLFAPTGNLETGWKWTFYVGNGLIAVLGITNILGEGGYITPEKLTRMTILVNAVIGAFQMWKNSQSPSL